MDLPYWRSFIRRTMKHQVMLSAVIYLLLLASAADGHGKSHRRRHAHSDVIPPVQKNGGVCETWSDEDVLIGSNPHRVEKRSSYLPPVDCTGPHEQGAVLSKAGCRPRPRVIRLPWPNSTEVNHMIPSHVIVDRCDGSCHHRKQSCLPKKTIKKSFPVMFAHCTIHDKTCGKICTQVEVDEHIDCGCECKIKRHHCNVKQIYRKDLCSCQCRDLSEVQTCYNSGRVWDPSKCMCRCPLSTLVQCSSKFVFDFTNSCKCIPEETNEFEAGERIERSHESPKTVKDAIFRWEIVAIACLTLLVLCLFVALIFVSQRRDHHRTVMIRGVDEHLEGEKGHSSDELLPANLPNSA